MTHRCVRPHQDADGYPIQDKDREWHLYVDIGGGDAAFCSGEFVGMGEGMIVDYDVKTVKRGGITCHACLEKIRDIKAVRL